MTKLSALMDRERLLEAVDEGRVRGQVHPDDPDLLILNYTEKVQHEKSWDNVTRQCRGLIIRGDATREDADVVARPFPKFFNYGEHPEGSLDLASPAQVTDKLDGSLGILYRGPDGEYAIASRGSFTSDQAVKGTEMLRRHLRVDRWKIDENLTYLFEIIYPENRIVLDYADREMLVLLGAVNINTGYVYGPRINPAIQDGWGGQRADILPVVSLGEALALEPRPNREGVVVRMLDGTMVKIKQEDYVRLHRIVTGLNERAVYEHVVEHGEIRSMLGDLPDEFHDWVCDVFVSLVDRHDRVWAGTHAAFEQIQDELDREYGDGTWERGDFARKAKEHAPLTPWLFGLLDGRDISPAIWKTLRPAGITRGPHSKED